MRRENAYSPLDHGRILRVAARVPRECGVPDVEHEAGDHERGYSAVVNDVSQLREGSDSRSTGARTYLWGRWTGCACRATMPVCQGRVCAIIT